MSIHSAPCFAFKKYGKIIISGHPNEHDFFVGPQKEWPKCRSPVKTVMKKMDPMKSYEQNKKKVDKDGNFGQIPL